MTAVPVTLRRGDAVKVVDGPRTETVPLADWPVRLDGLLDGLDRLGDDGPSLASKDADLVRVTLDQAVTCQLVVVLECLGDQIDGPREREHHEDDC